jgi:hypothetical protein
MLNRHKAKRTLMRSHNVARKSRERVVYSQKKDFAWRGKRANPLRTSPCRFSRRVQIEIGVLVVSLLCFVGVLLLHPFFQIQDIRVSGTDRLEQRDIQDAVQGSLAFKRLFIIPGANYFFVEVSELEDILSERFPLNSVQVTKQFPSTLDVVLQERISTIIYDDGSMYYLMGTTGKIVEPIQKVPESEWRIQTEIVTSTNELGEEVSEQKEIARHHTPDYRSLVQNVGEYPILYNLITEPQVDELSVTTDVIMPTYAEAIISWYEELGRHADLDPQYVTMTSPYDVTYYTAGPDVHVSLVGEQGAQIDRLRTALQHISSINTVSYIDVRFDQRVYWQ